MSGYQGSVITGEARPDTESRVNQQNANQGLNANDRSFTIVENWLLDSKLSVHEKIVFIAIKRNIKQNEYAVLSHDVISRTSSLSHSAVKRAINSLLRKNLIAVKSNKLIYRPNEYRIVKSWGAVGSSARGSTGTSCRGSVRPSSEGPSGSAGTTAGRPTGPTFKNNTLKTTPVRFVCCDCRRTMNETITLLDSNKVEYWGCPICHSDMVIDVPRSPVKIDVETLMTALKKNDPAEVFNAVDVIQFKSKHGEDITSFSGLLLTMLKYGIMKPDRYIPPAERRRREAYVKALAEQRKAEEQKKEAEYLSKRQEAERRLNSLTNEERITLENSARSEIPKTLRSFPRYVKEKMLEMLMNTE